jgi:hypothetical protein
MTQPTEQRRTELLSQGLTEKALFERDTGLQNATSLLPDQAATISSQATTGCVYEIT